ncbi:RHS repeat-associated core domain-containing protein [Xanthomonas oryzae]|uniref:RHS repeat-associated core domain-containing protein n=1 Tax=Xanthomonas oryzae TaxID=347 RepID=UPI0010583FA2|nr:RHS repeat-associated core domain-containing protein [Xanthomonas oryzae]QBO03358.1 type IV secretion protein Rhs [Xanthomonas oryzae pv. oryzae]
MAKLISAALLFVALFLLAGGARSAEPDFSRMRPDVFYTNYLTGYYTEGDSPCRDRAESNNADSGRIWDYLNPKFSDVGGEGCNFTLVRLSDGYTTEVHYQNWVMRVYFCSNGYTGPFESANGGQECLRNLYVPVVKPRICPDCRVGNPIDVPSADKILPVEDIPVIGGLGFSRTYHSASTFFVEGLPASLGPAWTSTHSQILLLFPGDEFYAAKAYAIRPDGIPVLFMKSQSSGLWMSEQDNLRSSLVESELSDGSAIYELSLQDGSREIYDASGRHLETNLRDGEKLSYSYDSLSHLTRVINSSGRYLQFNYDQEGRLNQVATSAGQIVNYAYNSDRTLETADRDGDIERYYYISYGGSNTLLTRVEDGGGVEIASYTYAYGKPATTQRAGGLNKFTVDYDTDHWQRVIVGTPLGANRNYWFRYLMGRRVVDRISEECAGCATKENYFFYDENLNLTGESLGYEKTCKRYDLAQNLPLIVVEGASDAFDCSSMSGGEFSKKTLLVWDTELRLPTEETLLDGSGLAFSKKKSSYNSRGQALSISQLDLETAITRTTTAEYCETAEVDAGICPKLGAVKYVDGPLAGSVDRTNFLYYQNSASGCANPPSACQYRKGDLWKVTDALGHVTETLSYDGAGRPLSIKDANGIVTDYTYHPRGWLTATKVRGADASSEADDRITRIDYWPTGLVKQVTQPDGAFTAFTYDAAHRLTDVTDNAGNTVHYTLDNAGNRVKEDTKDAAGTLKRTLSRVYNQLGQLKTQATAASDSTDFTYDANGNATKVTDALATATQSEYDPLNRLSRTLQDVAGIKADTKFEYDALDNLTKVTDPKGLDTKYEYNGFGDLVKLTSPDTGVTRYTYDSAGNRATQTDARGNTTAYSYDALNRLTKVTYPTSSLNVTYTYDVTQTACSSGETFSIGRLTKMQDGGAITQYCYNRFGDLVRKVQTSNGTTLVLRYDYTVGGQLRRMTYPDGAVVDYVRNTQGQTTEVGVTPAGGSRQVLLGNASYYPFGPAAGWTYGNGRTLARQYDLDYRPRAIQDTRPGGLEVGFGFDPAGNLTALTPAGNTTPEIGLGYDTLGRLTALKDGDTGTLIDGYSYDATGNRLSAKVGTATQIYTYPTDSHRLRALASVARTYDKTGNTLTIGGKAREFSYDASGRMSMAKRAGALVMNYRYNGKGEQVQRFLGTTNTYTLYDEAGHWLGDYDSNGAPKQQAIWLDDLPVGLLANANKLHYIEPDHLGSPRVVIDPTRNVAVWTWSLKGEAFGNTAPNQDPDGDGAALVLDMRFPGQRFDAASGLNQNYFRDYETINGRYVESDSLGLAAGISTYSYVLSSPLMDSDSLGQQSSAMRGIRAPISGSTNAGLADDGSSPSAGNAQAAATVAMAAVGIANAVSSMPGGAVLSLPITAAKICQDPDDEECLKLRAEVQRNKSIVSTLGKCRPGMSRGALGVRREAWLNLAVSRARRDEKCYSGGDEGHQEAHAAAWQNAGVCSNLMGGL